MQLTRKQLRVADVAILPSDGDDGGDVRTENRIRNVVMQPRHKDTESDTQNYLPNEQMKSIKRVYELVSQVPTMSVSVSVSVV